MNFTDFVVITNILDNLFEKELKSKKSFTRQEKFDIGFSLRTGRYRQNVVSRWEIEDTLPCVETQLS